MKLYVTLGVGVESSHQPMILHPWAFHTSFNLIPTTTFQGYGKDACHSQGCRDPGLCPLSMRLLKTELLMACVFSKLPTSQHKAAPQMQMVQYRDRSTHAAASLEALPPV